ncbi:phosphoribosylformylglycinamidine synthase subunit PurS [Streptomyces sp. B6B3]|uniref:phosphoribosylformylglycinamidine synthase subunit PurS n=1 Tax=Streptomyces sp. B6B3 TaxID=3153570 RepID=UPI00325DE778
MARVVVEVMLKPEILDPQGQAVQRALPRLGFEGVRGVRQGKRFELDLQGPVDAATLARIEELAGTFLANTVIEDYRVVVEDAAEETAEGAGAR